MRFETKYAYLACVPEVGVDIVVFPSVSHKGWAMEIGTGELIDTHGLTLYRENAQEKLSYSVSKLLINDMYIAQNQHRLIVATAFRMKWLNPNERVVVRKSTGFREEVIFPNTQAYDFHRQRAFLHAIVPYTCKHKRGM